MQYSSTATYTFIASVIAYILLHLFGTIIPASDIISFITSFVGTIAAGKVAYDHRTLAKAIQSTGVSIKGL